MVYAFDAFDGAKAEAVGIQTQTVGPDFIAVTLVGFIVVNKLLPAIDTDVVLLISFNAVFTDMSRLTLGTLHHSHR